MGGTGRFEGASGEFNLSAKSHGTLLPGTNVASQRDIDLNGYIDLPAGTAGATGGGREPVAG